MDKIDENADEERLQAIVTKYKEACPCIDNIIYTSALYGDGLESVKVGYQEKSKYHAS